MPVAKSKTAKSARAPKPSKKAAAARRPPKASAPRMSMLAAAHNVLSASDTPMTCQELIAALAERRLWASPNGKTPAQTLYAAIAREIAAKGEDARFVKVERGKFAAKSA